jgi:phage-related protein
MGQGRSAKEKTVYWAGSSKEDLLGFPDDVIDVAGYALHLAQQGEKHPDAKPLKGFNGASVLEIVLDSDGDAYRAVYTVQLRDLIIVLHAFQKKSTKGIKTPQRHLEIIKRRLAEAQHEFGRVR